MLLLSNQQSGNTNIKEGIGFQSPYMLLFTGTQYNSWLFKKYEQSHSHKVASHGVARMKALTFHVNREGPTN